MSSSIEEERIESIKALYGQKSRSLLQTIASLEAEIRRLRASSKDHKRSALISGLKEHVNERERVVEVLKAALCAATSRAPSEVDEFVHRKVTGAPEMFRPRSREEMGLEIAALNKQLEGLRLSLRKSELTCLAQKQAIVAGSAHTEALLGLAGGVAASSASASSSSRVGKGGLRSAVAAARAASSSSSSLYAKDTGASTSAAGGGTTTNSTTPSTSHGISAEILLAAERTAELESMCREQKDEIEGLHHQLRRLIHTEGRSAELAKSYQETANSLTDLHARLGSLRAENERLQGEAAKSGAEVKVLRDELRHAQEAAERAALSNSYGRDTTSQMETVAASVAASLGKSLRSHVEALSLERVRLHDANVELTLRLQTALHDCDQLKATAEQSVLRYEAELGRASSDGGGKWAAGSTGSNSLTPTMKMQQNELSPLSSSSSASQAAESSPTPFTSTPSAPLPLSDERLASLQAALEASKGETSAASARAEDCLRDLSATREELRLEKSRASKLSKEHLARLATEAEHLQEERKRWESDMDAAMSSLEQTEEKAKAAEAALSKASEDLLDARAASASLRSERDSFASLARAASVRAEQYAAALHKEEEASASLLHRVTNVLSTRDQATTDATPQTAATINMCLKAISICEARVTAMATELARLRSEEISNEVTVTACHASMEKAAKYSATLAWQLRNAGVTHIPTAPEGLFETAEAMTLALSSGGEAPIAAADVGTTSSERGSPAKSSPRAATEDGYLGPERLQSPAPATAASTITTSASSSSSSSSFSSSTSPAAATKDATTAATTATAAAALEDEEDGEISDDAELDGLMTQSSLSSK